MTSVTEEPLIYSGGNPASTDPGSEGAVTVAAGATLEIDEDRHPWLRGLDATSLAKLAVGFTEFICRPSFGSRTKREIELWLFAELKAHRGDWTSLGEIADDLAISRSKARGMVLEHYAREVGELGRGARRRILREHVARWPRQQIEQGNGQLRIVVDDPFIRDLLKNFAYGQGILLDQSFASEIQTFSWDSYARLLVELHVEGTQLTDADFLTLTGDLRRQIREAGARNVAAQVELDAQLAEIEALAQKARKSKAEQRRELALKLLKQYGPTLAQLAGKAMIPAP